MRRSFDVPPGHYELITAQYVVSDDEEVIDLFISKPVGPVTTSRIVLADEELANAPTPLIETVGAASVS